MVILEVLSIWTVFLTIIAGACLMTVKTSPMVNAASVMVLIVALDLLTASDMDML